MKKRNILQTAIATGRFTLPIVIAIVLFIWLVSMGPWTETISLCIFALTGYILIELNTTISLIRVRTTLHVSIYWLLASVCIFLHPFHAASFVPLLFISSIFCLMNSYESLYPSSTICASFLFLSLASMLFPSSLYYIPLLYLSMIKLRCMNIKSFFAGLIGLITPYWFLLAYSFWIEKPNLMLLPFKEVINLSPFHFQESNMNEIVTYIVILSLSAISSIYYLTISYQDKIRSRVSFSIILFIEMWSLVIWLLKPSTIVGIMQIQIICYSLFAGQLFSVTKNKFSNILLYITILCFIFLAVYNIWMQFFNFL